MRVHVLSLSILSIYPSISYARMQVCARTQTHTHALLTSLLRHFGRESGVKRKSRSHSAAIHGPVRAPLFTDKDSPAGTQTHTHTARTEKREQQKEGGGRWGGGGWGCRVKVTRAEKVEPGGEGGGAAWERVCMAAPILVGMQVQRALEHERPPPPRFRLIGSFKSSMRPRTVSPICSNFYLFCSFAFNG